MKAFVEGMEKAEREGISLIEVPHGFMISPGSSISLCYYNFVEDFFIYPEESATLNLVCYIDVYVSLLNT